MVNSVTVGAATVGAAMAVGTAAVGSAALGLAHEGPALPIIMGRRALERAIGKSGTGLAMAAPSLAALVGARDGEDARTTASLLLDMARSYLGELQRFRSRLDPATVCRDPGRAREHGEPALQASGAAARASLAVLALIGYLDQARPLTSDEPSSCSGAFASTPESHAPGRSLIAEPRSPLELPSAVQLARSWAMGAPAASMARSGSVNTSDWLEHLLDEVDAWLNEGTARPGYADVRPRKQPQGLERPPSARAAASTTEAPLQARALRLENSCSGSPTAPSNDERALGSRRAPRCICRGRQRASGEVASAPRQARQRALGLGFVQFEAPGMTLRAIRARAGRRREARCRALEHDAELSDHGARIRDGAHVELLAAGVAADIACLEL